MENHNMIAAPFVRYVGSSTLLHLHQKNCLVTDFSSSFSLLGMQR
jgi:hypothetical protein